MENYLKEPNPDKQITSEIIASKVRCIKAPYNPDAIIFSFLISKYANSEGDEFALSIRGECPVKLEIAPSGRVITIFDKQYNIGQTSFSSLFPISVDDLIPILAGMFSSLVLERRPLTEYERNVLSQMENLGVSVEKNIKIPNYKHLPLFSSLTMSIDPYIPDMTGNREDTIKALDELGIEATDKLEDLDEAKLNTLMMRIASSVMKVNPKFDRTDLITDRVYYMEYDTLELAFTTLYFLDVRGIGDLFQLVYTPNYAETLITKFRDDMAKGFKINGLTETTQYYVVDSTLRSPILLQLIFIQQGRVRRDKPIFIKTQEGLFTSRYFYVNSGKEGLIRVEDKYNSKD